MIFSCRSNKQVIDTTTVSTSQWGYLGAMNQGVTTTSAVQFLSVTDGTASWSSNSLSGFTSISGTTLTDGTATLTGGVLTSKITTNGAFIRKISSVTGATTLDGTYHIISATTTAASYAITLPDCATNAGIEYSFIYATSGGAFTVTITAAGSDTIDDASATTIVMTSLHDRVKLVSLGGTVWYTNV